MSSVLREHFDYLSLDGRAEIYGAAINQVIKPGAIVADLGCGFGVLGIQCLEAGAARVYGVDGSDAIAIARDSVARAGLSDRYECIRGSTYRTVLPEQVDLIICDHIGWFGFDYEIIPMLQDAKRRMLKPGGAIMPRRLRLKVAGSGSSACRKAIDGWSQDPIPSAYHWVRDYQINAKHPHLFEPEELCTEPVTLGEIDLTQDCPDSFAFTATLTANKTQQFNGIAGWFEAELAEDIWMTNSPLAENGIARNQVYLAAKEPFAVNKGDQIEISVRFRQEGDMIAWSIRAPGEKRRQKLSTWNSIPLSAGDLKVPVADPVPHSQLVHALQTIAQLVDGERTGAQIEDAVFAAHPDFLPSETEIRRFVRAELARYSAC